MAAKMMRWLRIVLLVALVCAVALSAVFVSRSYLRSERTYISSQIQFSFDGAASGLAPNGAAFDIGEIRSNTVLTDALNAAGMADRYTAEEIKAQMSIEGNYPDDVNQQLMNYDSLLDFSVNRPFTLKSYYPTLFVVKLYNDFDKTISKPDLQKLMQSILDAYEAYFRKVYTVRAQSAEIGYDLSEFDYPQRLVILSMKMEQSRSYAQELYDKAPLILYNGYGFNDISVRLGNLIDNDIARLQANISISAITKHTDRLLNQYRYEIKNLTNRLEKQNKCLADLDQLIASYDKNDIIYLSSTDSLTKIDGNSSETYDELVSQRKEVSDGITQIITRINNYNLLMEDLLTTSQVQGKENEASGETEKETIESAVSQLSQEEIDALIQAAQAESAHKMEELDASFNTQVEKYQAIMADFSAIINSYNNQTINESSVEVAIKNYYSPHLLSGSFAMVLFKAVAPLGCCVVVVILLMIIYSQKKKQKML